VLLLPPFFAFTGMRTQIGLVDGAGHWLLCALIIVTATAGKFGGTLAAARLTGRGWRDSAALGVLMNTRGLMELIVLNIGLDLKVISPTLFAMMVLMAVATTLMTTPILAWIKGIGAGAGLADDPGPTPRAGASVADALAPLVGPIPSPGHP
jgi:Kef-type K+ transport system membrane component KefB